MTMKADILSALGKIPISIDSVEKALNFAKELGLLPPGVALAADEAIVLSDKLVSALHKVGAITDEQAADADLKQLLVDLVSPEAEAQQAIDGADPQDPPV